VIRSLSMVVPQYLEKARRDHREMIDALRHCDQERLVALCRDHLLPSKNAYIEQQQRLAHLSERAAVVNLTKAAS
jgi:DNA-binding GntR family transcriptional regulator